MPFHGHHHHNQSNPSHPNEGSSQHGAASGIYQAAQTLGSIGAPAGNLRTAATGMTSAGTDALGPTSGNMPVASNGGQTAPPSTSGLPPPQHSTNSISAPTSAAQFETPRRAQTFRQSDELHLPSAPQSAMSAQPPSHPPSSDGQKYYFQNLMETNANKAQNPPSINVQQGTPQHGQSSGGGLPGALQSGLPGRPNVNMAAAKVPSVPQINTEPQTPSRSTQLQQTHNYSRSSPAGYDSQGYIPFSNTPESSKFSTPSNQKYALPPIGSSHSPLGLADIRPRADSTMSDSPASANPFSQEAMNAVPSNSNYLASWPIYAFDWCKWPVQKHGSNAGAGKMAIGSYLEDGHNFIQILETQVSAEPSPNSTSPYSLDYYKLAEATHPYPVTRILWEPPSSQKQSTDLLATSGDHLRLWTLPTNASSSVGSSINKSSNPRDPAPHKLTPLALLSNSKSPEHTAPLTSLDWNTLSPSLIITSSIDTTCTIWDIPSLTAKTQLIAHDKEVFDVRFCANSVDVFVSCGADGSVRMFDLRSLEHSTIIYEPSDKTDKDGTPNSGRMSPTTAQQTMSYAPPLLRLAASPHDTHLLATFSQDSNIIRILDSRQPGQALLELRGHSAAVNCIEWSPTRRGNLATGADDSLVLIWDLINPANSAAPAVGSSINGGSGTDNGRTPTSSWRCDYEVGNLSWAPQSALTSSGDWLGVSGGRGIWGVKA
ncbi:MAG: hypothetical protein M1814_005820 [Vezdaea aestivalis]|nr:MAG: hypothetical protein M1814_005820 [Vezdaea aestivalis]